MKLQITEYNNDELLGSQTICGGPTADKVRVDWEVGGFHGWFRIDKLTSIVQIVNRVSREVADCIEQGIEPDG